ncbi:MAG: hypothetical protein OEV78_12025 [Spirochaetia bacterium]|nr:hypothetical protein [Spirochaetia bacterium]
MNINEEKYTVEILSNKKETKGMHLIRLAKPADFTHIPGQYIKVSVIDVDFFSYLTISSHPDENYIELLVNTGGFNACKICALPVGSSLHISPALGNGFSASKFTDKTIYLVTHGSGMSAIKPLIEELRKNRHHFGQISLIYGVRTPNDFPFKPLIRNWMGSVEVFDIISKDPHDLKAWTGEIGHVQHVLQKLQPKPDNAIAVIVGSDEMESEVTQMFKDFGFSTNQILKNH